MGWQYCTSGNENGVKLRCAKLDWGLRAVTSRHCSRAPHRWPARHTATGWVERDQPAYMMEQPQAALGPCRCSTASTSPDCAASCSRVATSAMLQEDGWGGGAAVGSALASKALLGRPKAGKSNTGAVHSHPPTHPPTRGRAMASKLKGHVGARTSVHLSTHLPTHPPPTHLGRSSGVPARQSEMSLARGRGTSSLMGMRKPAATCRAGWWWGAGQWHPGGNGETGHPPLIMLPPTHPPHTGATPCGLPCMQRLLHPQHCPDTSARPPPSCGAAARTEPCQSCRGEAWAGGAWGWM